MSTSAIHSSVSTAPSYFKIGKFVYFGTGIVLSHDIPSGEYIPLVGPLPKPISRHLGVAATCVLLQSTTTCRRAFIGTNTATYGATSLGQLWEAIPAGSYTIHGCYMTDE